MDRLEAMALSVHSNLIPRFSNLRRVPLRYRQFLPLMMMKRYQCVVVGSAHGVLTVAITDWHNTSLIEALSKFTGCAIFPVLVEPARMRLLIKRIERCEQRRGYTLQRFSLLEVLQIHTIVRLLSYQMQEEM